MRSYILKLKYNSKLNYDGIINNDKINNFKICKSHDEKMIKCFKNKYYKSHIKNENVYDSFTISKEDVLTKSIRSPAL